MSIHAFANPSRFLKLTNKIFPVTFLFTFLFMGLGIYWSLFVAPPDDQQGEAVRMMYFHVPAAWMSMGIYTLMTLCGLSFIIWKHPLAVLTARAAAPIGACFTLICLITGSLWGKPTWGAWWVWDARLTSVLILFFLYIGYSVLINSFDDPEKAEKAASYFNLIGFINVPLIKWSVTWWNTLHQPASLMKLSSPSIDSSMLTPLLVMAAAYGFYFLSVLIVRLRAKVIQRKRWVLYKSHSQAHLGERVQ